MCGICCIFNLIKKEVPIDKACTRLHQRGPDKSATRCVELPDAASLTLCGHVLHLRGDRAVSQPAHDLHGNCLLWNGEIFDGIQVADDESDTQVLLSCLSRSNSDDHILSVMSKIQGPWAFIYWQSSSATLWFGRDVFGRRSLLWHLPESDTDQLVLSSVLIKPFSFTEIPSVGIYKMVCNQTPELDSKMQPFEISLFPWQHAVWPGSLDPVCDDTFQSKITEGMRCPGVGLCLCEDKPVPSQMPRLNKQLPGVDTTGLPALQDDSQSLEYLQTLVGSNSYLANLARQLSLVLLEAVRTRVFNQQRTQRHKNPTHTSTDSQPNQQCKQMHHAEKRPPHACTGTQSTVSSGTESPGQQQLTANMDANIQKTTTGSSSDLPGQDQFPGNIDKDSTDQQSTSSSIGTDALGKHLSKASIGTDQQTASLGQDALCQEQSTNSTSTDWPVLEQSPVNIDTGPPDKPKSTGPVRAHQGTTYLAKCKTVLDSNCNGASIDLHHRNSAVCDSETDELTNPGTNRPSPNGISLNEEYPTGASLSEATGFNPPGDKAGCGDEGEVTAACRLASSTQPLLSAAHVAILFSGGIDSTVLAALADRCVPEDEPIDLINVAFQQREKKTQKPGKKNRHQEESSSRRWDVPDRLTGYVALSELNPRRHWNFIEVNVTAEELHTARQQHISELLYPLETVLDDSIGCAVWFAARGHGTLGNGSCRGQAIHSTAKVLLCGMGADEQLAGYSRHRGKFQAGGWAGLVAEIELELTRLSARNLGRDDRIITDHGKESRFPFLDERVVQFLCSLPIQDKADLSLPRGVGEKLLLRLCALGLGLEKTATLPKRAIQFGSRIAKMENSKENASDKCTRLTKANS